MDTKDYIDFFYRGFKKHANWKDHLLGAGLMALSAGGGYLINRDPNDPVAGAVGAISGGAGAGLGHAIASPIARALKKPSLAYGIPVITAGLSDVLVPSARNAMVAAGRNANAQRALAEYQMRRPNASTLSKFPGGLAGAVAAGVLAASTAIALLGIGRAANHIADGKSIRVSTSLRKRRNQLTDLNLGLAKFEAKVPQALRPVSGRVIENKESPDDRAEFENEEE